jgi:hypothetical protein
MIGTLFLITALLVCGSAAYGQEGKVTYRGVQSCDSMEVEVSFVFDPASNTITEFEGHHRCQKGRESIKWKIEEPIKVVDGRFDYQDRYAKTVFGEFVEGEARGDFSPYAFKLPCDDGKMHELCVSWKASPQQ